MSLLDHLRKKNFDMFGGDYLDENKRLVINNRILIFSLLFFIIFSLILVISLCYLALNRQLSVIIPPYKTTVTTSNANSSYYKVWAEWTVNNIANINADNVKERVNNTIQYFDSVSLSKNSAVFKKLIALVITNKIDQTFSYSSNETTINLNDQDLAKRATVIIRGIANQKINHETYRTVKCGYQVDFKFEKQTIFISGLRTDCFNGNSITKTPSGDNSKILSEDILNLKDTNSVKVQDQNVIEQGTIKQPISPKKEKDIEKDNNEEFILEDH